MEWISRNSIFSLVFFSPFIIIIIIIIKKNQHFLDETHIWQRDS